MAQFKLAQNIKWQSLIEVLEVSDLLTESSIYVCPLSRLSTKDYNPRAIGSLCHFMLKVFRFLLKPVNSFNASC